MGLKTYGEKHGMKTSGRGRGWTDRHVAKLDKSKMPPWSSTKYDLNQVHESIMEATQHVDRTFKTRWTTTAACRRTNWTKCWAVTSLRFRLTAESTQAIQTGRVAGWSSLALLGSGPMSSIGRVVGGQPRR